MVVRSYPNLLKWVTKKIFFSLFSADRNDLKHKKFTYETLIHTNQADSFNCGVYVCMFYKKLLQKQSLEIEDISSSRMMIYNHLKSICNNNLNLNIFNYLFIIQVKHAAQYAVFKTIQTLKKMKWYSSNVHVAKKNIIYYAWMGLIVERIILTILNVICAIRTIINFFLTRPFLIFSLSFIEINFNS